MQDKMDNFPGSPSCNVRFYKMDGSMKETQVVQIVRTGRDHVTLLTPFDGRHVYTTVRLSLQSQDWLLYLKERLQQQQQMIMDAASQESCYGFNNLKLD